MAEPKNIINSNPYNYMDVIIGTQIVGMLTKISSKGGFTVVNLGILIVTISLWEIKSCIKDSFSFLKENYKTIFSGIYVGLKSLPNFLKLNKEIFLNHQQYYKSDLYTTNIYTVNVTNSFMGYFIHFLRYDKKYKINSLTDNDKTITVHNVDKIYISEKYDNISIEYEDTMIRLKNSIFYQYETDLLNNRIDISHFRLTPKVNEPVINKSKIEYVHSLINDPVIAAYLEDICLIIKKECAPSLDQSIQLDVIKNSYVIDTIFLDLPNKKNLSVISSINSYFKTMSESESESECLEKYVIKILKYHYPNLKIHISLIQCIFLFQCIWNCYDVTECLANYFIKENRLIFFDIDLIIPNELLGNEFYESVSIPKFSFSTLVNTKLKNETHSCFTIGEYLCGPNTFISKSLLSMGIKGKSRSDFLHLEADMKFFMYKGFITTSVGLLIPSNFTKHNNYELKFECTSKNGSQNIDKQFYDFIKYIKETSHIIYSNNEEIEIFSIELSKNVVTQRIDNPKYLEYQEKRNSYLDLTKDKKEINVPSELLDVPDKTITKESVDIKINVTKINKSSKTFDTMYLKKNDEKKLMSVISKFHSKKDLLKTLGLPNKCCMLLDGKPGTGKSSSILTIASYLKKDIYYMSMKNIKTNSELQMLFDHVINDCNGGIIVMEDIDAIGNFLHKRETYQNKSETDSLTLAYFLNLLQGTITPNGLIFIATTNHLKVLDPAFYRDGRFDIKITMTECDEYQCNKIYNKFIGRDIPNKYINILVEKKITPATFIFHVKDYMDDLDNTDEVILQKFIE